MVVVPAVGEAGAVSIELLALIGLVIAVLLYALLVRRRALLRNFGASMARQLAASNEIALGRIRDAAQRSAARAGRSERDSEGMIADRRSGFDRRVFIDRRRGRGRRTGGDRRHGAQGT